MKKFEVKLTGSGNEPKVSIVSPDGEVVYENWAATEAEARVLVEALNRQVSAAPVLAVSVAGETVELPMTVAPVLTPEEDRELVHAASVVCMTRFDRRYRVRAGLTESQYRRAGRFPSRQAAPRIRGRIPHAHTRAGKFLFLFRPPSLHLVE